jgi:hypothetical protein
MIHHSILHFLTLLLTLVVVGIGPFSLSKAAPTPDEKPERNGPREIQDDSGDLPLVATSPFGKRSNSVQLGFWSGAYSEESSRPTLGTVSLRWNQMVTEDRGATWGFDALSAKYFGAHIQYIYILWPHRYFEPTLRFGMGSIWSASDGIGTLINISRYHFRGEFTLEDMFAMGRRWQSGVALHWSLLGLSYSVRAGVAF